MNKQITMYLEVRTHSNFLSKLNRYFINNILFFLRLVYSGLYRKYTTQTAVLNQFTSEFQMVVIAIMLLYYSLASPL